MGRTASARKSSTRFMLLSTRDLVTARRREAASTSACSARSCSCSTPTLALSFASSLVAATTCRGRDWASETFLRQVVDDQM